MAAAVTEYLVERMIESTCRDEMGVTELFSMLQYNIDQDDGVILDGSPNETSAEVYGSDAQIARMRRMWDVVQVRPWVRQDVEDMDDQVEYAEENEGPGPLFFRLIVIIYKEWSKKWKLEDDESGSEDGGDDDGGDDEDDEEYADEMEDVEEVQEPGNAHAWPMSGGADMQALLAGLKDVYKGQARGVSDGRGAGAVVGD
jgi:hypothetical protein